MKTAVRMAFQDSLATLFPKAPLGLIKFSAIMKSAADIVPLDEGQKNAVIFHLYRGLSESREYTKINPSLVTTMVSARTRIIEEAGAEYGRCVLAKALSHVFNVSISKYKNLTAKRIFLSDLAEISEVLHKSGWVNDIEEFRKDKGEVYEALVDQMELLLKQEWTPDQELDERLEEAEAEFFKSINTMEKLTGFERGKIGKYSEKPVIASFFDPWYSENGRTKWWGIRFYPILNVINVQPPYLYFDALRKGLLAREAAYLFSHRALDKIEWIYEQADYCACRILEDTDEGEFWAFARHGLREESKSSDGIGYYSRRESIVGNDFIKEVFSRVNSIGRFRPYLNDQEYQTVIETLALKPRVVRLDDKELRIMRILASNPRVSMTTIAQKIGATLPTTRRMFEELNRKTNMWFSVSVDVDQIGLSEYLTLLKVHPGKEGLVTDILWDIPYCTRIYKVHGPMNLFVRYNIPFSREDYLHRCLHQLHRPSLAEDHAACKVQESYYNINLRYYDVESGGWDVHWDEWGLWLREFLFGKEWYRVLYEEAIRSEKPKLHSKIDKLDLQIINQLVLDCRLPFTEIGRRLGITGVYVSQKVHRLVNQGTVVPIMGSYRIGLDEVVFIVIDCDSDVVRALSVALNELPMWQGWAVTGDIEGLIAMIFVPTGDVEQLFHVIDRDLIKTGAVRKCWLHFTGKWVSRRRLLEWLPIELFSKSGEWIFEGERYLEEVKKRLELLK